MLYMHKIEICRWKNKNVTVKFVDQRYNFFLLLCAQKHIWISEHEYLNKSIYGCFSINMYTFLSKVARRLQRRHIFI